MVTPWERLSCNPLVRDVSGCQRTLNWWLKPCVVESCIAGYVQNIMTEKYSIRNRPCCEHVFFCQEYSLRKSTREESS